MVNIEGSLATLIINAIFIATKRNNVIFWVMPLPLHKHVRERSSRERYQDDQEAGHSSTSANKDLLTSLPVSRRLIIRMYRENPANRDKGWYDLAPFGARAMHTAPCAVQECLSLLGVL